MRRVYKGVVLLIYAWIIGVLGARVLSEGGIITIVVLKARLSLVNTRIVA